MQFTTTTVLVKLVLLSCAAFFLVGMPTAFAHPINLAGKVHGVAHRLLPPQAESNDIRSRHIPFRHYPSERGEDAGEDSPYISATTSATGPEHIPFSKYPSEE
ncbi:hypothetical protein B0H16DRAFT_1902138 [Mycena metata]|uniref:Uncharacterized protein n=1 Tax=Mycena metata TaxID=1033252 RepID=A0AAD7GS98_9AGAR|nr:hypothetical protein B0H16DRAFT_1902138 [Mycena metata]